MTFEMNLIRAILFTISFAPGIVLPNKIEDLGSKAVAKVEDKIEKYFKDINANEKKNEILDQIFEKYNKKLRPKGKSGHGPVEIGVQIHIMNMENLDDEEMDFTVQLIARQQWLDRRLKYDHIQPDIKYIQLIDTSMVWSPDLVFNNEKSGSLHELTFPNTYVRIYPQGEVLLASRMTLKISCILDLHYYPMDLQSCSILMGSFAWTNDDLIYEWSNGPDNVGINKGIKLSRFQLISYKNISCETYVTRAGAFDCVELRLNFKRQFGYYLIQIYAPCIMLVIVSWVGFWLEPSATEARVSLCVTSILAVVTQTYGITEKVPPASYVKAIDVWLFATQFMVFASILEYAYVNYLVRFYWKRAMEQMNIRSQFSGDDVKNMNAESCMKEQTEKKAKLVDTFSKILFPGVFAVFNMIYWMYYLNEEREDTSSHDLYQS